MPKSRRHALGQHFLKNPRILNKISSLIAPRADDVIIEIGAGTGALTQKLSPAAGTVIAVEKDPALIPVLTANLAAADNVRIIAGDILDMPLAELTGGCAAKVVGNLPYAISSLILFKVLSERESVREGHFLLQKEVGERLSAQPGTKKYAPFSLFFQNHFILKIPLRLAPGSFSPPPRVDSVLVSMIRRVTPRHVLEDEQDFHKFVEQAFRQRRKTLLNNLKSLGLPMSVLEKALTRAHIDPGVRPEMVSLAEFATLYTELRVRYSP